MAECRGGWQEASLQKSPSLMDQHHGLHGNALTGSTLVMEGVPPSCRNGVYPNPHHHHVGKYSPWPTSFAALWPPIAQKKTSHYLHQRDWLMPGTGRIQFELHKRHNKEEDRLSSSRAKLFTRNQLKRCSISVTVLQCGRQRFLLGQLSRQF